MGLKISEAILPVRRSSGFDHVGLPGLSDDSTLSEADTAVANGQSLLALVGNMANEDVAVIAELGDRTVATRLQGVAVSREMLAFSISLSSL